jgi:hypothetical protein
MVDELAGFNFEPSAVLVVKYSLIPSKVKYAPPDDVYVGELNVVALLFPCKSVIVVPLPGYDDELLIS